MKKILSVKMWMFAIMLCVCSAAPAWSQTGFEEDVDDVPAEPQAPIDHLIVVALVAGCAAGYVLLKRETKLS